MNRTIVEQSGQNSGGFWNRQRLMAAGAIAGVGLALTGCLNQPNDQLGNGGEGSAMIQVKAQNLAKLLLAKVTSEKAKPLPKTGVYYRGDVLSDSEGNILADPKKAPDGKVIREISLTSTVLATSKIPGKVYDMTALIDGDANSIRDTENVSQVKLLVGCHDTTDNSADYSCASTRSYSLAYVPEHNSPAPIQPDSDHWQLHIDDELILDGDVSEEIKPVDTLAKSMLAMKLPAA